jgi:hypothetical protein
MRVVLGAAVLALGLALASGPASAQPAGQAGAPVNAGEAPVVVPPPPPPASPEQESAPAEGPADDVLEQAVQVIPDVESREDMVIDGKRQIRVKTRWGGEYMLIEEDGVAVTTVLQPESQRLRVPNWILLEW